MAKKTKTTVSKTIKYDFDLAIRLKEEVLHQNKKGNKVDEKDLCPTLIGEALTVREKKRSKKPTISA